MNKSIDISIAHQRDEYQPEVITKVSLAASPIGQWLHAIHNYSILPTKSKKKKHQLFHQLIKNNSFEKEK